MLIDRFIHLIISSPNAKSIPIGGDVNPTYFRWFVIRRNRFINFYLHNFLRDDEEDLHDHRMLNISIVLRGPGYEEDYFISAPCAGKPLPDVARRKVIKLIPRFRLPSTAHRVVLYRDVSGHSIPIWSLFIGFPHWRDWGFWCSGNKKSRWVPWQEYIGDVDPTSARYGVRGKGCAD